MRQMKESSEQHCVIKPTMNPPQRNPKTTQNGKGPQNQESQNGKPQNQSSPPSRNRGRRRGRGGRKSDQGGEPFMRPSSRPCTAADKPVSREAVAPDLSDVSVGNGSGVCESQMGFPSSSKSLTFPARPGFGQLGTRCIVKANHFFAELPNKDLNQYDVR